MLIDDIKLLLNTNDEQEQVINILMNNAICSIKNYLNNDNITDVFIYEKYSNIVTELVTRAYKSRELGATGIKSMSQGQRSMTFDSLGSPLAITDDLKELLPSPYVRLF